MSDIPETTEPNGSHHLDDVRVGSIVYWGFVSVAATLLTMMFLHSLYGWYIGGQREAKSFGNNGEHEFARTEVARQENVLNAAPGWVDEEKTRVAVPIDRAMELTLKEYNSQGTTGDEAEPAADASEEPSIDQPGVDAPSNEEPRNEEPGTTESATEEPTGDDSPADEPAADAEEMEEATPPEESESAPEGPATEEPAADQPPADEPATEEPSTDEPTDDVPPTEEPASDEPASDEPTTDEPTQDESPSK